MRRACSPTPSPRWPAAHSTRRSTADGANAPREAYCHTSRARSPSTRAPTPQQSWHTGQVVNSQHPPLASTLAPPFRRTALAPQLAPSDLVRAEAHIHSPRAHHQPPPLPKSTACYAQPCNHCNCATLATHPPQRDANARGAGHAAADPGTLGTQAEPHPTHRATRTRCLLGRRPRRRCMHAAAAAAQRLLRRRRWSTRTFQKRDGA